MTLRPLTPFDAAEVCNLFGRCSDATVAARTHGPVERPTHGEAFAICLNDGLVAVGGDEVCGMVTWRRPEPDIAMDFALLIEDACQGAGLGRELLDAALAAIAAQGCAFVCGATLLGNRGARRLLATAGYPVHWDGADFVIELPGAANAALSL